MDRELVLKNSSSAPAYTLQNNYLKAAKYWVSNCGKYIKETWDLTLYLPNPQNGQTHSNNSSEICQQIV